VRSLLVPVLFLLFTVACNPEWNRAENRDSLLRDSVKRDSLHVDSLRIDSLSKIPPPLRDSSVIPAHYQIMDAVYGNLNLDEFTDAILVLHHSDEEWMDERARPVLILLGDSSRNYHLALRNDHLTSPKVDGQMFGEPYNGIEIDSGTFIIRHYGGSRFRWTYDYQFEYDPAKQNWYYTANYASIGDMLGEMNDLDSTGQCIPYDRDTLILKRKVDIRKFVIADAEIAQLEY
jgi:hypothetical protein